MADSDFKVNLDTSGLDKILQQEPAKAEAWLDGFVEEMVTNIKLSFGTSPPGLTYTRGSVQHVASQPGYPPNVDTGNLRASMRWEKTGKLERTIFDGTEYGIYLEEGAEDAGIEARPFVQPEFADAEKRIGDDARRNLGLDDGV